MNDVYLIGIGQTKISKNAGIRGRYLSAEAVSKALEHAGIEKELITMFITGNMMSGILTQQQQLGLSPPTPVASEELKRPR